MSANVETPHGKVSGSGLPYPSVLTLLEDDIEPSANEGGGDGRYSPVDLRIRCPAEPEESDDEKEATDQHWREAGFGHRTSFVCSDGAGVARLIRKVDSHRKENANEKAQERERGDDGPHVSLLLEDNREDLEGQVKQAVDEGGVDCNAQDHWLCDQHLQRAADVFGYDVGDGDLGLLVRMPVTIVAGVFAHALCFALEEGWSVL